MVFSAFSAKTKTSAPAKLAPSYSSFNSRRLVTVCLFGATVGQDSDPDRRHRRQDRINGQDRNPDLRQGRSWLDPVLRVLLYLPRHGAQTFLDSFPCNSRTAHGSQSGTD